MDRTQLASELRRHRAMHSGSTTARETLEFFIARFPQIMRQAHRAVAAGQPMTHSLANFGVSIPAQWFRSVYLLCAKLERLAMTMVPEDAPFLLNIKEKWGELRVYLEFPETINMAQQKYKAQIAEGLIATAIDRCPNITPI